MAVVGLKVTASAVLLERVQNDDDVAPARSAVACQQNAAVGHGVNRIAEVGIFTADAVKIIAEMMIFGETLGVIRERTVLAPERKVEARRHRKRREFE